MTRAKSWLTWGNFQEPAEFVETVPFTQTRGYIQASAKLATFQMLIAASTGASPRNNSHAVTRFRSCNRTLGHRIESVIREMTLPGLAAQCREPGASDPPISRRPRL